MRVLLRVDEIGRQIADLKPNLKAYDIPGFNPTRKIDVPRFGVN
jgi:hypothetical protein